MVNPLLELMETAASLPGVEADIKWRDCLVYSVGGKMFATFSSVVDREHPEPRGFACKVDPSRFLELTDLPGVAPAPYLARAYWISVEQPLTLPVDFLKPLLIEAHRLVAARLSKKCRLELGLL